MALLSKSKWIIGNWKMHKTHEEALAFIKELGQVAAVSVDHIALAVPFTTLPLIASLGRERKILIGAQNLYFEKEGAFTGEISAPMLVDAGAKFTLIGHSERRTLFDESDLVVNEKVKSALKYGLKVVLCIGETLVERKDGRFEERLFKQLSVGLAGVTQDQLPQVLIAYEPIWAIGTGTPASVNEAEKSHLYCREVLSELYGKENAVKVPLLYGGSASPENAKEFLSQNEINGLLIGKASLSSEFFAKIINYAK